MPITRMKVPSASLAKLAGVFLIAPPVEEARQLAARVGGFRPVRHEVDPHENRAGDRAEHLRYKESWEIGEVTAIDREGQGGGRVDVRSRATAGLGDKNFPPRRRTRIRK